ncbi:MAG: hypothetical protein ACFFEV_04265 [Candidatus Thorarchaeota archaeon]
MKLHLSIDTEADNLWNKTDEIHLNNLNAIPRFQQLCDDFSFPPTYLVTYPVANLPKGKDMLGDIVKSNRAEIGAHLHPWSCPPFESITSNDSFHHPCPHHLPIDLFRRKMETLTAKIKESFGKYPVTYRGGRWGIIGSHLSILEELGYKVDTTVTPQISWKIIARASKGKNGINFSDAPLNPYYPSSENICVPGESKILEIPLTVLSTRRPHLRKLFRTLVNSRLVIAARRFGFGPQMLRPLPQVNKRILKVFLETAIDMELPQIHMMTHSSELMYPFSPYNRTAMDTEKLYSKLHYFFSICEEAGLKGGTLGEYNHSSE